MGTASGRDVEAAPISQVDDFSRAEQRLLGRQARGSAIGLALGERLHPTRSRHADLSDQWSPELWEHIELVRNGTAAATIAAAFTPYAGRGRRVMTHLIELAAAASASADHLRARDGSPGRTEWRLPLVRDALTNAAPRGFACWSDDDPGPVRRPKLEGEPHLGGSRMVVAFGLGECVACGDRCDESVRNGRHARAALYCAEHHLATWNRSRDRDLMHNALEHAARFHGIR